jgi:hypothetical protein
MNKLSRLIFALVFVLAYLYSEIRTREPSVITPVTAVQAQGRSSVVVPVTRPVLMDDSIHMDERPWVDLSDQADKEKFPCASLQITAAGAVCDGYRLDFPEVNMKDILEGGNYLPRQSEFVFFPVKVVGDTVYKKITLVLRWESATPEFLQVYREEYLPYWEDRIPYRLLWNAQYEVCSESCATVYDEGEFLPADIEDLPPSLAADVNFNGVPAAFWNENIKP